MSHTSSIHRMSEVAREVDDSPEERGVPESVPDMDNIDASSATEDHSRGDTAPTQSVEAHRRAAVILEVLAGVRGPSEAATALGVTVSHYYVLERKALAGLVAGLRVSAQRSAWSGAGAAAGGGAARAGRMPSRMPAPVGPGACHAAGHGLAFPGGGRAAGHARQGEGEGKRQGNRASFPGASAASAHGSRLARGRGTAAPRGPRGP
jgi:hypothetical protein